MDGPVASIAAGCRDGGYGGGQAYQGGGRGYDEGPRGGYGERRGGYGGRGGDDRGMPPERDQYGAPLTSTIPCKASSFKLCQALHLVLKGLCPE
jgi:hypothetical protein